jgi:methylmalonyl-CoA mutase
VLVTLGEPAEFRARVGYAQSFFATAGLVTREVPWTATLPLPSPKAIACLCGSDDRYALEAVAAASTLRESGYRVVLAGRPGGIEKALKAAGVTCLFIGCDVVATLEELVS